MELESCITTKMEYGIFMLNGGCLERCLLLGIFDGAFNLEGILIPVMMLAQI